MTELDRLVRAAPLDQHAAEQLDAFADAMLRRLALAYATGAVDPARADPEWAIPRVAAPNFDTLLALARRDGRIAEVLAALLPRDPDYAALEGELARVASEPEGSDQREERIAHLRASLERWRWLSRDLPMRRVDVLTPLFELRLRGFSESYRRRVIVGARRSQTPSFAAEISTITLNPSWTPPTSIMVNELVPRFRRTPAAFAAEGYEAIDRDGRRVDVGEIAWSARPFPYTLRQLPGPRNALGRVRFGMSNPFAIYLHDTPSRSLFERDDRALSHGCIRVANPVALAAVVLDDAATNEAALEASIEAGDTRTIQLSSALPVYVLYLTASVGDDGAVRYAADVYGRDRRLLHLLDG